MQDKLEQWQTLCAEAATEQDPDRLMKLVEQIDRLLGNKQERLNNRKAHPESAV